MKVTLSSMKRLDLESHCACAVSFHALTQGASHQMKLTIARRWMLFTFLLTHQHGIHILRYTLPTRTPFWTIKESWFIQASTSDANTPECHESISTAVVSSWAHHLPQQHHVQGIRERGSTIHAGCHRTPTAWQASAANGTEFAKKMHDAAQSSLREWSLHIKPRERLGLHP